MGQGDGYLLAPYKIGGLMTNRDDLATEAIKPVKGWQNSLILFVASCGGMGQLPLFPGTWGSLLGLVITLLFLGVWVSGEAEVILGKKDHSSIVIDELVGFFVSILLLPHELPYLLAAFIFFRLFDIWKPWSLLESLGRGWGVMLDDLAAGIITNLLLQVYILIF